VCWKRTVAGVAGRHLVNSIASVLWILTHSFHLVKYRSRMDVAWVSRLTMVSVRQDCVRIVVSSAYNASCELGMLTYMDIKYSNLCLLLLSVLFSCHTGP
jgi:hypothetical protein